jgi:hypothetical protein
MDSSVPAKDEIWFLGVCHQVSNALYYLRGNFHMPDTTDSFVTVTLTDVLVKTAVLTIGLLIFILHFCVIIIIIIIIIG